jgi:xylulose-5-phosphate/fructose-6-phosphate phosphoketolase
MLGKEIIEGSFHAHQVPLPAAATDKEQLELLNSWLLSYNPKELFNDDGSPNDLVTSIIPSNPELRMGQRKETYAGYTPTKVADWKNYAVQQGTEASCMLTIGALLECGIQAYESQLPMGSRNVQSRRPGY